MLRFQSLSHLGEEAPSTLPYSSTVRTGLWRAAARTHPFSERGCFRKRVKFLARGLAQRSLTHQWLGVLSRGECAPLWSARPRLSTKLQRPYLCCNWQAEDRLNALSQHYALLPRLFSEGARELIYKDKLTVLQLSTPETSRALEVRLFYRDQFEKEGELTLAIDDVESGLTLAGITFALETAPTGRRVRIGGLQASSSPQTRLLINEVAKELHGLRPKAFALWCLQGLCAAWSVTEILAVADSQHIYRHAHKRRDFSASYDEFWAESDGQQGSGGFWQLPLTLRERAREELKPSRRKSHERRYAMLSTLRPLLLESVSSFRPHGSAIQEVHPGERVSTDKLQPGRLTPETTYALPETSEGRRGGAIAAQTSHSY